jgi:hypothetical protein
MLAGLASAATHPFPVGDPPVELGAFEGLGRAVVAGQLGQLAGELGGQVAGLAAGQPLTQHRQGGPGRLFGVLAGVDPARSWTCLMNSSNVMLPSLQLDAPAGLPTARSRPESRSYLRRGRAEQPTPQHDRVTQGLPRGSRSRR